MTKIRFYILKGTQAEDRQLFACRLAEKALRLGHHIYIHTDNTEQSEQLDRALWSFRADSFVPHQLNEGDDTDCPVLIGHDSPPSRLMDFIINLSSNQPVFFSQFEHMAELLNDVTEIKQAGRERFRFYQQRGYEIETHHL
ncbi:MAG: DNA polymerase III subunit chi [Gammaproteobacteria bacterium]|nr:MAG: DNA polymerase III subunit chi [Gammaproteobacteria bacterium]